MLKAYDKYWIPFRRHVSDEIHCLWKRVHVIGGRIDSNTIRINSLEARLNKLQEEKEQPAND